MCFEEIAAKVPGFLGAEKGPSEVHSWSSSPRAEVLFTMPNLPSQSLGSRSPDASASYFYNYNPNNNPNLRTNTHYPFSLRTAASSLRRNITLSSMSKSIFPYKAW